VQEASEDEEQKRIADIAQRLTVDQCEYLRTIARYDYKYSAEAIQPLLALDLIVRYGQLLVATQDGREVAKLCVGVR
jgi:hypothetical protein